MYWRYWKLTVILLVQLGASTVSLGQTGALTENPIWASCPPLAYVPSSDSVALKRTTDSVASYLTGQWELVEISGGWGPNHQPARLVELTINQQRQGIVKENGIEVAGFQLTLLRRWSSIWFKIDQHGRSIVHFSPFSPRHWGLLHGCEQKLIISDARGDGTAFAFRRVPSPSPPKVYDRSNVTALLNYATWSGKARAMIEPVMGNQPCSSNQFTLFVETESPYRVYPEKSTHNPTDTTIHQQLTQRLRLANIPLAIGRYDIVKLDTCADKTPGTRFELLSGNRLVETYYPQGVWCGWIEITHYNPSQNLIAGLFEFYLLSRTQKLASFSEGAFSVDLKR